MEYTSQELRNRFKTLPEELRQAIASVEAAEVIAVLVKKYQFSENQHKILGSETGRIMLGVTHPRDYIKNLAERLEMPKEKAIAIAQDVNEQIFKPIRASLKKIHGIEEPQESRIPPTQNAPAGKQEQTGEEEKKYKFDLRDTRFAPERPDDVKKLEDERERMILEEMQGQKLTRVVKNPKKDIRVDIKWDDQPPPQVSYNKGEDPYKEII